ncbi:hypothetical protein [Proteiniphilum sp. X52]|uniref:hypothetical protein n=1 Tax=Proteiniphilum sp. X52 TaxID=2382159 RepID=UPI0013141C26|nr:hypothetical protein [Proteiniphilum sp. X52]
MFLFLRAGLPFGTPNAKGAPAYLKKYDKDKDIDTKDPFITGGCLYDRYKRK